MFVVIENTPGYLSEQDDPPTFEDMRAANEYLRERVAEYVNHLCEGYDWDASYAPVVTWEGDYPDESGSAFVSDPRREHDLGRYFSIEPCEGGITPEGLALGHRYVMGHVNAYCPKCSDAHGVCVLDCDYDLDK